MHLYSLYTQEEKEGGQSQTQVSTQYSEQFKKLSQVEPVKLPGF